MTICLYGFIMLLTIFADYKEIFMEKRTKSPLAENKLSARIWFNLCLFGFTGQVAWNLENMYYNTFMYNTVYEGGTVTGSLSSMTAIRLMVALSAVTAVLTTFIMGNLSDKMNKRKVFISAGYVVWGIITFAFGFITKDNVSALFGISDPLKAVTATAIVIIVMDCVMTFMGSTSNDSAFNAWVTDVTTAKNRATAESVLAILPVVAMVVVVAFGGMIDAIGGYPVFFFAIGGFVILCGIIGLFTLKDSRSGEKKTNTSYWADLVYGFKPSVVKENSKLYLALSGVCIFQTAVQVFFPYLLIYLDHSLGLKIENLLGYLFKEDGSLNVGVIIGVVIGVAAVGVGIVLMGKLIDKIGKNVLLFVAVAMFVGGLIGASFAHTIKTFVIAAVPLFAGYGLLGIMINATVRDYTPEDKTGLFQGIRMIFFVLIPMVVGPAIGDAVCKAAASGSYVGDDGLRNYEPCAEMFLAAGLFAILILIPCIILRKKGIDKKEA